MNASSPPESIIYRQLSLRLQIQVTWGMFPILGLNFDWVTVPCEYALIYCSSVAISLASLSYLRVNV